MRGWYPASVRAQSYVCDMAYVSRPVAVTVVVVLGMVEAVLGVLAGVILIAARDERNVIRESGLTPDQLLGVGIAYVVIGAIVAFLVLALARGSNFARFVIGLVSLLHLAGGVYALLWLSGDNRWSGVGAIVVALAILYLLFGSERSREFFSQR